MDVLTIALACSLYPDATLVETLVQDASRGHVYFVGDTIKLDTYDQATSPTEAKKLIAQAQASGGNPVVGLMGIPLAWAERFGKGPDDLFDACSNISVGTAMLAHFEAQCRASLRPAPRGRGGRRRPLPREFLRPCILGHLGRELGIRNFVEGTMRELPAGGSSKRLPIRVPPQVPHQLDSAVLLESSGASGHSLFFDDVPSPSPPPRADDTTLIMR